MTTETEILKAKLEVTNAALLAAVSKAEWQAKTNHEMNELAAENCRLRTAIAALLAAVSKAEWQANELAAENCRLRNAMQRTIDDNLDLADGDVCTLIHLKRALSPND